MIDERQFQFDEELDGKGFALDSEPEKENLAEFEALERSAKELIFSKRLTSQKLVRVKKCEREDIEELLDKIKVEF